MEYNVHIDDFDRNEWEQAAKGFADYSIYQTWPYQQVRGEMDGQDVSRFMVKDEKGAVVSMGQVRIKHIKCLNLRIGYIQRGPLFFKKDDGSLLSVKALNKIKKAYIPNYVDVLRLRPSVCEQEGSDVITNLEQAGFAKLKGFSPYHTIMIPLTESEEQIRKNLSRGWRRNLKKAEKAGIIIKNSTGEESFELFNELYAAAKKRKGFKGVSADILFQTQQMLKEKDKMHFIVAYYEGEPVTVHASSCLGEAAIDMLAANSEKTLECGASYLVYWNAFLSARNAGMVRYDIGGIDPINNPSVYQFKVRMGGDETFHIGTFEACSSLLKKCVWRIAERTYKAIRK